MVNCYYLKSTEEIKMKKFTKILAVILAALFVVGCFAACSGSTDGGDKKVLIVGFDQDGFVPFGYTDDNGEWIGFDIELAKECVKLMDDYDDVQLYPLEWNSKDQLMDSGAIDIIWNGFTIQGREDDYEWSKPYMSNRQVIVVREDSGINTVDDLAGKVVGSQKDSSGLSALKGNDKIMSIIKDKTAMEFDGYETALMELEAGSVDALVIDEQVITVKIKNGDVKGCKVLDESLATEDYGIGAKKGNTELIAELEKALDTLAANGKVAELSEKYFGYDATVWANK